jgi:thioredoxin 1
MHGPLHVACLCAAWCRTCDAYKPVLDAVCAEFVASGRAHPPRWIDIEDEAGLVGELDVETFPTLLVSDARGVLFAGPLTPQPETLRRLLQALAAADARPAAADPAYAALAAALTAGG